MKSECLNIWDKVDYICSLFSPIEGFSCMIISAFEESALSLKYAAFADTRLLFSGKKINYPV